MPMVHSIELKNSLNHLRITIGVDAHYCTAYFLHHFPPKRLSLTHLEQATLSFALLLGRVWGTLLLEVWGIRGLVDK